METGALLLAVLLPIAVCLSLLVLLYVCCRRRYRLNWWERNLIEVHQDNDSEKQFISPAASSRSYVGFHSTQDIPVTIGHGSHQVVTHKHIGSLGVTKAGASTTSDNTSSMGSGTSSPVSECGPLPSDHSPNLDGGPAGSMGSCRRFSQQLTESLLSSMSPSHKLYGHSRRFSMQQEVTLPESTNDVFWVPPAVVERKRAQSLVPHLGLSQGSLEGR